MFLNDVSYLSDELKSKKTIIYIANQNLLRIIREAVKNKGKTAKNPLLFGNGPFWPNFTPKPKKFHKIKKFYQKKS